MLKKLILLLLSITISGCTIKNGIPVDQNQTSQTIKARQQQMQALTQWQITGKIAFIREKQRDSASLRWQKNAALQTETLKLNTLLGINILTIEKKGEDIELRVDGKNYQTRNLEQLIEQLTGLKLPTKALSYWLKGLPYHADDKLSYHPKSQLPSSLSSFYNNQQWQISYGGYREINHHQLATKFTIIQKDLRIKILIHKWQV